MLLSKSFANLPVFLVLQNLSSILAFPSGQKIYNIQGNPKIRKLERNFQTEFEFISMSSRVASSHGSLETYDEAKKIFSKNIRRNGLFGTDCKTQLQVDLIDFYQVPTDTLVSICLFQQTLAKVSELFLQNAKINVHGNTYDPFSYYTNLSPVSGFVIGEINSLVTGFLIEGKFYGTIRLFDALPFHHIGFYIEPKLNLNLYVPGSIQDINSTDSKFGTDMNTMLFEYVRHEGDLKNARSKPNVTFDTKLMENYGLLQYDVSDRTKVIDELSSTHIFDLRRRQFAICELCIWVEPIFATKFGFTHGIPYGIGDLINILHQSKFILEGIDFSRNNIADQVRIIIKELVISDDIKLSSAPSKEPESAPKDVPAVPANTTKPNDPPKNNGSETKTKRSVFNGENEVYLNISAKTAYENLRQQLAKFFRKKNCCAILGYIYHNLSPKIAYSTVGGLCSRNHNIGIISGSIHGHKIGGFDLGRYTLHTIGHLLGANDDDIAKTNCKLNSLANPTYFNPSLMHPVHKLDVGLRPNSMQFSACAKIEIASFLSSALASYCLRFVKISQRRHVSTCGNGIVENNEECDCGLIWQCHKDNLRHEQVSSNCCAESDTILACKKIGSEKLQKIGNCHRPFKW